MKQKFYQIDNQIIHFFKLAYIPLARFAIFLVYFWFGILKVLGLSPAGSLVKSLYAQTIPFLSFNVFYAFFSWYEVLIGILFLFPKMTRVVLPLLILHLLTTAGPLVFLPQASWQSFLVPTLEGQYIIKNILIIATAIGIAGHLHTWQPKDV